MDVNHLQKPPQIGFGVEGDDAKYVSGLSTIFVATIQEAKERISQIEYIFCSQLYPHFQKITKGHQKLLTDAKIAAECEWKEKESLLQLQIKELCNEKEKVLENCESLKLERLKVMKRMSELEEKLLQKSKEVDEGMELHGKLLHLLESKSGVIASKEKLLKEQEEKMSLLFAKSDGLEKRLCGLEAELLERNEEVAKGKDLQAQLLRQIESHAAEKRTLDSNQKKMKQLLVEDLRNGCDDLKEELQRKKSEIEEYKGREAKFLRQVSDKCLEVARKNQQLEAQEREKSMLLSRINDLESKTEELHMRNSKIEDTYMELARKDQQLQAQEGEKSMLLTRISDLEGKTEYNPGKLESGEYCQNLVQQLESKTSELLCEKQKTRDVTAAYKRLKSQYNFLFAQCGLTTENMHPQTKTDSESDPPGHHHIKSGSTGQVKQEIISPENSNDEKAAGSNQTSSSGSPPSAKSPAAPKRGPPRNYGESSGAKRPASKWRDTRSRQSPSGHDPHDDFLDTPYENMRANLNQDQVSKACKEEMLDAPAPPAKDIACDNSSDDKMQEPGADPGRQKRQSEPPRPGPRGFKYVESVRKKSEREKLKGIECKQCKKFYDAVLPDGADDDKGKYRCEHLDGVSRHRYRYVPPLTPKGFWDIGFESEI